MLLRPSSIMGINQTKKANGVKLQHLHQKYLSAEFSHKDLFSFSCLSNQSHHFLHRLRILCEKNARKTVLVLMNIFFGSGMSPNRDSGYVLIPSKKFLCFRSGLSSTIIQADYRSAYHWPGNRTWQISICTGWAIHWDPQLCSLAGGAAQAGCS